MRSTTFFVIEIFKTGAHAATSTPRMNFHVCMARASPAATARRCRIKKGDRCCCLGFSTWIENTGTNVTRSG